MAKLSISINDDLLKAARSIALNRGTSLNQLVHDYLEQIVKTKSHKEEARHFLLTTRFDYLPTSFDRDSIYKR